MGCGVRPSEGVMSNGQQSEEVKKYGAPSEALKSATIIAHKLFTDAGNCGLSYCCLLSSFKCSPSDALKSATIKCIFSNSGRGSL